MKKFMIGLPLDNEPSSWRQFLHQYREYISCVYFSLPLGDKYQTRKHIADQFKDKSIQKMFWLLLDAVADEHIPLELVLNTPNLTNQDIVSSWKCLLRNDIRIDSITILDQYYDTTKSVFGDIPVNYSYNNFLETISQIPEEHHYNKVIVGRKNLRNFTLARALISRKIRPVLLLNNGCNHYCGWCAKIDHCYKEFNRIEQKNDYNELYARFSIMPHELSLSPFKEHYTEYKINNRNDNLTYLEKCISSYIDGNEFNLIREDINAYCLWSRLSWFYDKFNALNYEKIVRYKAWLLENSSTTLEGLYSNELCVDLTDRFTFDKDYLYLKKNSIMEEIQDYFKKDMKVREVILGSHTCAKMIDFVDTEYLSEICCYFKQRGIRIIFSTPIIRESFFKKWTDCIDVILNRKLIDSIMTNDYGIMSMYGPSTSIIAGRLFDKRVRDPRIENLPTESSDLVTDKYRSLFDRYGVSAITLECLPNGFDEVTNYKVYVPLPFAIISSGNICEFAGIGLPSKDKFKLDICNNQCFTVVGKCKHPSLHYEVYKRYNTLVYKIKITQRIMNSLNNNTVRIMFTPTGESEYEDIQPNK